MDVRDWMANNRRLVDAHELEKARQLTAAGVEFTLPADRGLSRVDWAGFPSQLQRQYVLAFTADEVIVIGGRSGLGMTNVAQRAPRSAFRAPRLTRLYGRVEVDGERYFVHRRWFDAVVRALHF